MLLIDPQGHWQRVLLVRVEEEIPSSFFQERTAQPQKCSKKKKKFPYVGFSSEVPSPSSPSLKDQNTLLRQHKKALP